MCSRGIPETGRLPAGTGRGAAQWSQASVADAHWGFCEHQQNMLPGSTTVSSLSSLHPRSILLTGSHHFNPLPSAARSGFHIRVRTEEPFITEHPQEALSELGSAFRGMVTILGVLKDLLAKESLCVSSAETEKQMSKRTRDLNR